MLAPIPGLLDHRHAFRPHINRIQRLARGHEQPVSLRASKAKIGARLRKMNLANQSAVWSEDMHTVVAFPGHPSRRGPYIAVDVTADAIGVARRHVRKHAPVLQPCAIYRSEERRV